MDDQNKNLILATVLSALVLLVWFVLFPPAQQSPATLETATSDGIVDPVTGALTPPAVPGAAPGAPPTAAAAPAATLDEALVAAPRVPIDTSRLTGSIALAGGRIDDVALKDYRETLDDDSPLVRLLSPSTAPGGYEVVHGWVPAGDLPFDAVPGPATVWTVPDGARLTPQTPVTMTWDNGAGLVFRRTVSIDDDYMLSVVQSVENATGAAVRLAPYASVDRHGEPDAANFFILHEGVVSRADGELEEIKYGAIPDLDLDPVEGGPADKRPVVDRGWIGFTDKYWMTTLIPDPGQDFTEVVKYVEALDVYQVQTRLPVVEVAPGATATSASRVFAGAKEWETLRRYQNEAGIAGFVDSIDWGWFYFLTKPIFVALHWLNAVIGNMGVAIVVLTLGIKAILLPLAYKSYVSMARMKELQPQMEALKERAGEDRQKLQTGMMELYKSNRVNPAAGCLPILLQIPIFFSLYKVIFVTIELRHAAFFGPFQDLSAPDPTSIFNLFGLLPYAAPEPGSMLALLFVGILPILLGISMWLQQKLNPAPTDPTQAMIFAYLPWVFMFMLGGFASGLVVYWIANNTITFLQQYAIMRSHGTQIDLFGNIKSGFKRKAAEAGPPPPAASSTPGTPVEPAPAPAPRATPRAAPKPRAKRGPSTTPRATPRK